LRDLRGHLGAGVLGDREHGDEFGLAELKEMPLSRGLNQAFSPRAKDKAEVKLELSLQRIVDLVVFLGCFIVELGSFVECGLEIFDLLSKPVQEVAAFRGVSRP
jgi:hypothetical protein